MADDVQIFDSFVPLIPSGKPADIVVSQVLGTDLKSGTPPGKDEAQADLINAAPGTVHIQVDGPQTLIGPDDISGVYPAPGSTTSPANYVPHIALYRRTLPWERTGPDGIVDDVKGKVKGPWLALLMITEDELNGGHSNASPTTSLTTTTVKGVQAGDPTTYTHLHGAGMSDDLSITTVTLSNDLLSEILPALDELPLLCHVKRSNGQDTAIVVCNRLPNITPKDATPVLHIAMLVSLENRGDLYGASSRLKKSGKTTLVVLNSWTFTPSSGFDFMEVMHLISVRPNGGVLRFGNLPKGLRSGATAPLSGSFAAALDSAGYMNPPLDHEEAGNVKWRSPLRPFPTPPRSDAFAVRAAPEQFAAADPTKPLDYSNATAFELGRLLALGDPGIREDLRSVRMIFPIPKQVVATSVIPQVLQKPDWVVDPDPDPWSFLETTFQSGLEKAQAVDVSGIAGMAKQWQTTINAQLGAGVSGPSFGTVAQIGIDTISAEDLAKQFPEVINAGLG